MTLNKILVLGMIDACIDDQFPKTTDHEVELLRDELFVERLSNHLEAKDLELDPVDFLNLIRRKHKAWSLVDKPIQKNKWFVLRYTNHEIVYLFITDEVWDLYPNQIKVFSLTEDQIFCQWINEKSIQFDFASGKCCTADDRMNHIKEQLNHIELQSKQSIDSLTEDLKLIDTLKQTFENERSEETNGNQPDNH